MRRLREILLTQHIGAIAIGLILGEAVLVLVNAIVRNATDYIIVQQAQRSLMSNPPSYSWTNLEASLVSVGLQIFAGFALMFWLYARPTDATNDDGDETPMRWPKYEIKACPPDSI